MIIVMKPDSGKKDIENIIEKLHQHGLEAHLSTGKQVTIIGVIGDKGLLADANMELMPGVDKLVPITESYKLVNRKFNAKKTVVNGKQKCLIDLSSLENGCYILSVHGKNNNTAMRQVISIF